MDFSLYSYNTATQEGHERGDEHRYQGITLSESFHVESLQ